MFAPALRKVFSSFKASTRIFSSSMISSWPIMSSNLISNYHRIWKAKVLFRAYKYIYRILLTFDKAWPPLRLSDRFDFWFGDFQRFLIQFKCVINMFHSFDTKVFRFLLSSLSINVRYIYSTQRNRLTSSILVLEMLKSSISEKLNGILFCRNMSFPTRVSSEIEIFLKKVNTEKNSNTKNQ